MPSKHTPEPWVGNEDFIYGPEGECISPISGECPLVQDKANAQRIVACVNACEGINPEAVPDLLEAAKVYLWAADKKPWTGIKDLDGIPDKALRAAIAKAEGADAE